MSLLDFESKAIEKGLDIAKAFLDKLIMPSAEELGVLIKEPISYWRLKNQIKILNKTKELCEKNDISLKQISLKLLCPLLELSSMEEDEDMQNLWVNLLTNYIDVNSKLNNVSFPEVLHRLSTDDIRLMNVIKENINKEFHLSPINSSIDYDTQIQSVANLLHLGLIEDGLSFGGISRI